MRSVESLGCSLFRLRPSELSRSAYTWQNGHAPQWHELQAVPLVGWQDALQCCGLDAPHSGSSAVATAVPGAAAASAHVVHAQHAQNSQCFVSAPHQFAQRAQVLARVEVAVAVGPVVGVEGLGQRAVVEAAAREVVVALQREADPLGGRPAPPQHVFGEASRPRRHVTKVEERLGGVDLAVALLADTAAVVALALAVFTASRFGRSAK